MKTRSKAAKKEFKFEQAVKRLEQIVDELESGGTEIDKALLLYQEGMELIGQSQAALKVVNSKIKKLSINGQGGFKTEDLNLEEGQDDQEKSR
jgi:exodeoxyribonuclease VII small subunit